MDTLTRLLRFLSQHNVPYWHDVHPIAYTAADVATVEHIPPANMAKTIVCHSEKGYAMAVLPADTRLNVNELRTDLGVHALRLATEQELAALFLDNCELGAMPPFGNGTLYEIPVFIDKHLTSVAELAFNAGTHHDVVRLPVNDFIRLVQPQVMQFAEVEVH